MNAFDQGLERIPEQFRSYCWELCLKAEGKQWETFKSMVMQMRFGGVSSEAEARRLFWAEQITHKVFFINSELPSQIAFQLSEDIQNSFQHVSRPISLEHEDDKLLIEILNYYFPNEEALANFDECLKGAFDEQFTQSTTVQPSADNDFHFDEVKEEPIFNEPTIIKPRSEEPKQENISPQEERPKVHQYLEAKNKKQNYSEISSKIKEIIDEFYSL